MVSMDCGRGWVERQILGHRARKDGSGVQIPRRCVRIRPRIRARAAGAVVAVRSVGAVPPSRAVEVGANRGGFRQGRDDAHGSSTRWVVPFDQGVPELEGKLVRVDYAQSYRRQGGSGDRTAQLLKPQPVIGRDPGRRMQGEAARRKAQGRGTHPVADPGAPAEDVGQRAPRIVLAEQFASNCGFR